MTELKRCPFCDGKAECRYVGDNKWLFVYVCSRCKKTPVKISEGRNTMQGAINIWNKRCNNVES